jgi:N,N'-diacetyllegionaminate synthase
MNINLSRGVFIIAEAGVNHNGDLALAYQMIDAAFACGCDAVKFQTAVPELVMVKQAPKADYQKKTTGNQESQLAMAKKIHLPLGAYKGLKAYAHRKGILFLSTPFDLVSIDALKALNLEIFKIPSGEITNLPFLRKIGGLGKKVILSTGMATMAEIGQALKVLVAAGTKKENTTVLHCNTEYPTPFEDVHLRAMLTIRDTFKVKVGYSDHTLGIEVPIAAVVLGASIIEKHFTLDKNMQGPDHKASLQPPELEQMVEAIRNVEKALGSGIKKPSKSESKNIFIARRSIVAARNIQKGERFTVANLIAKRPAAGLSPMLWDKVIGKSAKRDFSEDEMISL